MVIQQLPIKPDVYRILCDESELRFIRLVLYNTLYTCNCDFDRAQNLISEIDVVL